MNAEAYEFFYNHGGFMRYNRDKETPQQARIRSAEALAEAEERLKAGPYRVTVEPDENRPMWTVTLWEYDESDAREPDWVLGSLGGIEAESDSDPYMRVAAAELAYEYIEQENAHAVHH